MINYTFRPLARIKFCLLLFIFYWHVGNACAGQSGYDKHLIAQIQNYLNSLQNITGKFVQTNTKGNLQTGQFFLSKPGKLKWEYKRPKQICILMNAGKVFYRDYRLDQTSEYHSPGFFLQLLTSPHINLFNLGDGYSIKVSSGASIDLYVTNATNQPNQSSETFIIRFSKDPLEILSLTLSDGTKIQINTIIKYPRLNKNIFTFK